MADANAMDHTGGAFETLRVLNKQSMEVKNTHVHVC